MQGALFGIVVCLSVYIVFVFGAADRLRPWNFQFLGRKWFVFVYFA